MKRILTIFPFLLVFLILQGEEGPRTELKEYEKDFLARLGLDWKGVAELKDVEKECLAALPKGSLKEEVIIYLESKKNCGEEILSEIQDDLETIVFRVKYPLSDRTVFMSLFFILDEDGKLSDVAFMRSTVV